MARIKGQNYRRPAFLLIFMNLLGFGLLFVAQNYDINILYVGLGILGLFILMYVAVIACNMGDKFILPMVCMLITIGIMLLCRINISKYGFRQIAWIAVGGCAFFAAYAIYYNFRHWNKFAFVYVVIGIALFMVTRLFGVEINGAKNWISIGGLSLQPGEIIKIMFIMFLSCYFSKSWNTPFFGLSPKTVSWLVTYIFIGFFALQTEWGTILVLFSIYIFMLYVYEKDFRFLLFNLAIIAIVALLGYKFTSHIQQRVAMWLDPWSDTTNLGYQITQSLYAISAGSYFGTGIGNGSPGYIPEVHSDFIFAAICEEMGVFGGAAVIILFFLIAYRCLKISIMTEEPFDKALSFGITIMFAVQTFIIIGGVIKMIPLTGITLPFISYGGTSMLISFASLGIIQAISAKSERAREIKSTYSEGKI